MAIELEKLLVSLGVDRSGFTAGLNQASGQARAWGSVVTGIFQGVGQAAFRLSVDAVRGMVREIDKSIDAASDLNESVNKTTVVFGQSAKEVLAWSNTTADAMGISQRAALEYAGTLGNLFVSQGVNRAEAAEMSKTLIELAADQASFNNIAGGTPAVLDDFNSGVVGQYEPLRKYGIVMSEANVQQKAMQMGLAATAKEITEQDKVRARQAMIVEQSATAMGDFARTADGAANAQRRVDAQLENYRTMAGKIFLPFREQTLGILADVLQNMAPYAENIMNQFALGLARGIVAITPVLAQLAQLFTFWLKPGSPPRLLPDLTKWGIGAANAYLSGWTQADFGIFSALANSVRGALTGLVSTGSLPEGGLFGAILGSRSALATAVAEFAATGRVSEQTFAAIRNSAGEAGQSIEGLARAYFGLQAATDEARQAQAELTAVQDRYNNAIAPISGELGEIDRRRQEITDRKRIDDLKRTIASRGATADEKELANLELRQIELRRQQGALEAERDTAVEAAQDKLTAAQAAQEQAQIALDLQRESIAQQQEYNSLLSERMNFERQMAAEAKQAADAIRTAQEQAQRQAEQLTDAQLAYRMAVADTPGQIAILRDELAKYNPQQVEYWQTLTQIQRLEEGLAKQRAASGGGGLLPEIPPIELPDMTALNEASAGVTALIDAIRGLMEGMGLLPKTTKPSLDETAGYVTNFGTETKTETETWGGEWTGLLRAAQAGASGDWGAFWTEIDRIYYQSSTGLYTTAETQIHKFMILLAKNNGDIKLTWEQTWDEIKATNDIKRQEALTAITDWLADVATAMYNGGEEMVMGIWRGFEVGWGKFGTWISGLTMPWDSWELPSWLQRNSPSELEQSLTGTADALREIQGLGGLRALGAGAGASVGGNTTVNYSPVINVGAGADVAAVEGAVRRAGDDFIRQWRARGNG